MNPNPSFLIDDAFIIAEIGGNHEGNFDYAKKLLLDAAASGAHAVKFQVYQGDKIVSPIEGPDRNKHFKKFELSNDHWMELIDLAKQNNIIFMSSLWDQDSVELFDPHIQIHKVGSGDLTNYPLLEILAKKNKPLLIATAMSTLEEIKDLVAFIERVNTNLVKDRKLVLMHCVAMYGDPQDKYANLLSIRVLQDAFPHIPIGYSDHTKGTYACEIALGMGCKVIEVHFTDDKTREFRDHHLSIDKDEMFHLMRKSHQISTLLGTYEKKPVLGVETEERIRAFRRSVYVAQDLPAGTVLRADHLTTIRPKAGIDARRYHECIGKKLNCDLKRYHVLQEEFLE